VSQSAQSHITNQERTFHGEDKAGSLVQWLNSPEDLNFPAIEGAKAKVAQILDNLAEVKAMGDGETKRRDTLVAQINDSLRACAMISKVWLVPGQDGPVLELVPHPEAQYEDSWMVIHITDLWRAGLIGNLRRCKQCGKWLYARFEHKAFCSKGCQLAEKNTEKYKARRRVKLRENYAFKKQQKERNKLNALMRAWPIAGVAPKGQ
jgi:hypothetical protein